MPPSARSRVDEDRGVVYGSVDDEQLLLDVYRPPVRGAPGRPWSSSTAAGCGPVPAADMADPARQLARAGYVACARRLPTRRRRGRAPPLAGPDRRRPARRALGARQRRPVRRRSGARRRLRVVGGRPAGGAARDARYPRRQRGACRLSQPGEVRRRPGRRRGPRGLHAARPPCTRLSPSWAGPATRCPSATATCRRSPGSTNEPHPSSSSTAPPTTWCRSTSRSGWCPPSVPPGSRWSTWSSPTPAMAT